MPAAKPKTLKDWIESDDFGKAVAATVPQTVGAAQFVRVALNQLVKNPALCECTRESIFGCLLDCASTGLLPDGRNAHLIPFRNRKKGIVECVLILDYKGLVTLAQRHGGVRWMRASEVCEQDEFEFDRGRVTFHRINFRKPRGKPYAYYSTACMQDGSEWSEVMTVEEIDKVRRRSRAGNDGPWVTDPGEMSKKTVARRQCKWLPTTPEFDLALSKDGDRFDDLRLPAPEISAEPGAIASDALADALDPPKEFDTRQFFARQGESGSEYANRVAALIPEYRATHADQIRAALQEARDINCIDAEAFKLLTDMLEGKGE